LQDVKPFVFPAIGAKTLPDSSTLETVVLVHPPSGSCMSITLPPHSTVADVMNAVHDAHGLPPSLHVITVGGKPLVAASDTPLSSLSSGCIVMRMSARLVGGSGRRPPAAQLQLEAAADAASTASAACPAGKPGIDQDSDGEEKQGMPKASSIPEEHESRCRISFFAHFVCRVTRAPACRSLPPGLPLNLALMPRECLG
jgi:hypothetical protein